MQIITTVSERANVHTVYAVSRTLSDAHDTHHDAIVDSDPNFLAWSTVQAIRQRQTTVCEWAEGIDSLP